MDREVLERQIAGAKKAVWPLPLGACPVLTLLTNHHQSSATVSQNTELKVHLVHLQECFCITTKKMHGQADKRRGGGVFCRLRCVKTTSDIRTTELPRGEPAEEEGGITLPTAGSGSLGTPLHGKGSHPAWPQLTLLQQCTALPTGECPLVLWPRLH